ncbi:hypothetical protein M413DRAFT_445891 [Hebeloma cylindrosporum]|uniref:GST N-terminal domain-containing protein n=1 Tax=Hebeloma cylindrosporum TaxID=76867 RepID=A0A0C3BX98_HEBCY|nr:hypothetical protein M413DRAFT_445891 [Hebeloma cylindrosporum h7]
MAIIFYDIPCTLPNNSWSPNTLKTRYTLNFKGIPYETVWVEYPDIEPLCKKLGIPPTSKKEDGNEHYTLPAIHDPSTGAYLSDSILIAEYLEKTYPDTPQVFPHHTIALQATFAEAFWDSIGIARDFIIPAAYTRLNPRSQEYFRRTKSFGKSIEDRTPKGEDAIAKWEQFRGGLGRVDKWYAKSDGKGAFLMGETLSWETLSSPPSSSG